MICQCPICGESASPLFKSKDYNYATDATVFSYLICNGCQSIFIENPPANLDKYYPKEYHFMPNNEVELLAMSEGEKFKLDILLDATMGRRGRLLEIGPGNGAFLSMAKNVGFEPFAIDRSQICCDFMSNNLNISNICTDNPIDAIRTLDEFDFAVMWHVIEHLPNQAEFLTELSKKIKSDGLLIIAAPNPDSIQFKIMGRYWPHLDAPRHLCIAPEHAYTKFLKQLNWVQVYKMTNDPGGLHWNYFGWKMLFKNKIKFEFLKNKIEKIFVKLYKLFFKEKEALPMNGAAYTLVYKKIGT
jgi:2-polyprenyl-3-methyl-5-hydroxy-6-metoxy-1,4-benzoquinol methylase